MSITMNKERDWYISINGLDYNSDLWRKRFHEGRLDDMTVWVDDESMNIDFIDGLGYYVYFVTEEYVQYLTNGSDDTPVEDDFDSHVVMKYVHSDMHYLEKLIDEFIQNGKLSDSIATICVPDEELIDKVEEDLDPLEKSSDLYMNGRLYSRYAKWLDDVSNISDIETVEIWKDEMALAAEFIDGNKAVIKCTDYSVSDDFGSKYCVCPDDDGDTYDFPNGKTVAGKYVCKGKGSIMEIMMYYYEHGELSPEYTWEKTSGVEVSTFDNTDVEDNNIETENEVDNITPSESAYDYESPAVTTCTLDDSDDSGSIVGTVIAIVVGIIIAAFISYLILK